MKILGLMTPFEVPAKPLQWSYPLSICYLGKILEEEGYVFLAYDFLFDQWKDAKEKIKKIIQKEKPEIIMASLMTTNRFSSFELAKLVKKINPKIRVIFGGVHSSMMFSQILLNFPVDFVVIGEGERTIVELIKAIEKKVPLNKFKDIKGIAFKEGNKIIKTECRKWIQDLDSLPFPKHEYFIESMKRQKAAYLIASRGCPINCLFCLTSKYWGYMRRTRSVDNFIEEIKYVKKKFPFVTMLYFNDDEFIMRKDWILDFCNKFIKEKINIGWECNGRVTSIDEEVIKAIKKAGCAQLNIGIESGSPKIIELIGKKITNEQAIEAYRLCEKYGVNAKIYLMVGLPGEDKNTIKETIQLIKKIKYGNLSVPAIFQLYPGTPIYEDVKRKGLINDDFWLTDKPAPLYSFEHSKWKLVYWTLKIAFFHKLYRGELWSFLFNYLKNLNYDKIKKIFKTYLK